jgi:hypothetical protein
VPDLVAATLSRFARTRVDDWRDDLIRQANEGAWIAQREGVLFVPDVPSDDVPCRVVTSNTNNK